MSRVVVSQQGRVVEIRLDRAEVHNAFDEALIAELTAILREVDARDDIRAVVLTGSGATFSAGADLQAMLPGFMMGGAAAINEAEAELQRVMPLLPVMNQAIGDFFAAKTAKEAYEEGQQRRLLIGIVSQPKDLAENTQLRTRGWYVTFPEGPVNGATEFPGPPYRLSETPATIARPPRLGEHTEAVLAAL